MEIKSAMAEHHPTISTTIFFLRFGTNSLIPKRDIRSDPTASKSFEFLEILEIQENSQNTIVESMEIPKT